MHAALGLPRFSKDGTRLVFRSRVASVNPVAIPFDPVSGRAGTPHLLDTRNNVRIPSDMSRDGKHLAYYSIGEVQEDVFVGEPGPTIRRVTDDPARDRAPVFTPDGRSLIFSSNRSGIWAPWIVGIDGGGLRKLADSPNGAVSVHVSPQGDRIVFTGQSGRSVDSAPLDPALGPATELPGTSVGGKYFSPTGWSPDGSRLAGSLASNSGRPAGIGIYDFTTRTTTEISADQTYAVKWLADGRRIVYFRNDGWELMVLDTVTRKSTAVKVLLPHPATTDMFAVSPDNRTIYYGAAHAEADVWIVERK